MDHLVAVSLFLAWLSYQWLILIYFMLDGFSRGGYIDICMVMVSFSRQVEVPSSSDSSSFTLMFHLRLFSQVPFSFAFITDSFFEITIIYYVIVLATGIASLSEGWY